MTINLTPQEIHWVISKHFEDNHKLKVSSITWSNETGSATLKISSEEEKNEPLYSGRTKDEIDRLIAIASTDPVSGRPVNKINGIKEYRLYTGGGLKEGKDYLDYYFSTGKFKNSFD